MSVFGVKIVLLAVNALPAKEHFSVCAEVVPLVVKLLPACRHDSVFVKIVNVAVDILEFAYAEGTVSVAVFIARGSLDELGRVGISCGKRSSGVFRGNGGSGASHSLCDVVIQSVIELVIDRVDDIAFAVLNVDVDAVHISLAGNTDVACLHCESEHAIVSCAVNIASILEVVDRSLHPAAAEGSGAVLKPVVISERGIHFFDKCGRVAGIAAVMIELIDVRAQIDAAAHQLALHFTLYIAAGEEAGVSRRDLGDEGVVVDVIGVVTSAGVGTSPKDAHGGISHCEAGTFLEIDDRAAVSVGCIYDRVVAVQEILAVTASLRACLEILGIREIYLPHIKTGIIDDRGNLVHMIIMIVGEINIEIIEMVIIEIIDQSIIFISEVCVHEEILAAAREHGAVAPDTGIAEINGSDLHISARCLNRHERSGRGENHKDR